MISFPVLIAIASLPDQNAKASLENRRGDICRRSRSSSNPFDVRSRHRDTDNRRQKLRIQEAKLVG
jgi:hypothetical protein